MKCGPLSMHEACLVICSYRRKHVRRSLIYYSRTPNAAAKTPSYLMVYNRVNVSSALAYCITLLFSQRRACLSLGRELKRDC